MPYVLFCGYNLLAGFSMIGVLAVEVRCGINYLVESVDGRPAGHLFHLRSERSGGIMQSVGIGIFIGFSYFYVHALCMSLGLSGRIPALVAAWGANITFSIAAAILFYRMRT